jgi:pimeloyl-ACP methyl ester carboxylesterase
MRSLKPRLPASLAFVTGIVLLGLCPVLPAHAGGRCLAGASAVNDARAIAGLRAVIARQCPCASFDGSSPATSHDAFVKCAKALIDDASDGTPLLGFSLRSQCKGKVKRIYATAACGYPSGSPRVACCQMRVSSGRLKGRVKDPAKCVDSASGSTVRQVCTSTPFAIDACSSDATETNLCKTTPVLQETVNLPSAAEPAHTPGSAGVVVTNPKLVAQFDGGSFSLNQARYTRHHLASATQPPDAILILIPGFEGGAGNFRILAENLILRAQTEGFALEVWAYDRRSNQLEDLEGLDLAEEFSSPEIALDWLYGGELGLTLHPVLAAGPNRRAVFYDTQADVPFIADWTGLVFSRDINAVVSAASAAANNHNVFLGGHSAGTGFTARYAATDFNLTGVGPADPGWAKLRGLVLLEGGGGTTAGTPLTADSLDRIEAKFDGGLFGAVRDNAARCVDGTTACTIATEASDCAGQVPPKCTLPVTSYAVVPGLLNARVLAAGEVTAIQAIVDPDTGENILRVDQGAAGNNAVAKVPDLAGLGLLPLSTAFAGLGNFIDDDGLVAGLASFVATSVGGPGTVVDDIQNWRDITEGVDPALIPDNGPAPTALPAGVWGQEREVTRMDHLMGNFYLGGTNFTDTYYPSSGLSVTSITGVCTSGTCSVGNVGASCSTAAQCSQATSLDSSALSIGRGRRDIENLTQASGINIPVIAFGGTNGLATVPGVYTAFGSSIGTCTAPSCDASTPRVVDASNPNPAFPTFGGVAGGYEVITAEGFAHLDVLTAEDEDAVNPVTPALVAFLKRNMQ